MVDVNTTVLVVQIILMVNAVKEIIVLGFAIKRDYRETTFSRTSLMVLVLLIELSTVVILDRNTFFKNMTLFASLVIPVEFALARLYSAQRAWDSYENLLEKQLIPANSKLTFMGSLFFVGFGLILILVDTAETYIIGTILILISFVLWVYFLQKIRKAGTSSKIRRMFIASILLVLNIIALGIIGLSLVLTAAQGMNIATLNVGVLEELAIIFETRDAGLFIVLAVLIASFRSVFIGMMGFFITDFCRARDQGGILDDDDAERKVVLKSYD